MLLQQNILRLHVAVNYFKLIESVQALEKRVSKFADKLQAEALEFILLDQLVEIDVEQLEDDAHVIAEHEVIKPVNIEKEKRGSLIMTRRLIRDDKALTHI